MRRRKLLKQIGASSMIAVGAVGAASARETKEISLSEVNYITTEVNGETQDLTLEEFDQHPDTQSLSEVEAQCGYECKECCSACCPGELCAWTRRCGSCSGC